MKITAEHYGKLETACKEVLAKHPGVAESYASQGMSPMRLNWDILAASTIDGVRGTQWICSNLYSYMNDTHINTALKNIMDNSGKSAVQVSRDVAK